MEYTQKRISLHEVAFTCNSMEKDNWFFVQCLYIEEHGASRYANVLFQRKRPNF